MLHGGGFAPPVPLPLPAPVAMSPRPCTPVPSQGLVGNTRAGRKAARAAAATAGAQGSAVDVREEAKLQSCIATLWAAFEAMGEAGNFWGDYMALSPATRPQFRAMTAETLRECPLSTLRGACGVLKRWQAWALEAEAPWTNPSAIVVALWLRSLRTRGPTAAHGALRTLAWLELRIGMRMSTSVALVKQQGSVVGGHTPVQAVLLRVRVWAYLEDMVASANPFVRGLCLAWLLCTSGALRFAHLQRSVLLRMTPCGMFLRASRGKARTKGVRAPMEWSAPRLGLTGVDLGHHLDRHLALIGSRGYLLPDFGPKMCGLANAQFWQPHAMSLPKFMTASASLLQGPPANLTPAQVNDITSYSCRRTLPSLSDRAGFEVTERVLLGGWTDKGGMAGDITKEARRLAMPMLYSDHKQLIQLRVKYELLEGVRLAVAALSRARGEAFAFDPDWDDVSAYWPQRSVTKAATDLAFRAGLNLLVEKRCLGSMTPLAVAPATPFLLVHAPGTPAQGPPGSARSSSDSSASTSSSSSTASTRSARSASALPALSMALPWLLSRGKNGHLHFCKLGDQEGRTQCGRELLRPESGSTLAEAFATGKPWSPRCYAALPAKARAGLLEASQVA